MRKLIVVGFIFICGSAGAMNYAANMVRSCTGLHIGGADNYILRCPKSDEIVAVRDGGDARFFAADNDGDMRGAFLENIPDDDDYIYVNVASNLPDARYQNQRCYRFITKKDERRDGFYATEICEYDRPDWYL